VSRISSILRFILVPPVCIFEVVCLVVEVTLRTVREDVNLTDTVSVLYVGVILLNIVTAVRAREVLYLSF